MGETGKGREIPPTICSDCYGYLSTEDGIVAWCPSCRSTWLISPPVPPELFGPRDADREAGRSADRR